MYVIPSPAPGFPRPGAPALSPRAMRQRSQQASAARQLMGMSRSGLMGCNLRGHYLAGLAQDDDLDVTAAPIDTSLVSPADIEPTAVLLPDDTFDVSNAPISTGLVAPAAASPLTNSGATPGASITSAISSALPGITKLFGGGSASANPAAGSSQRSAAGASSSTGKILLLGALGVGALLVFGGGR